MNIKANYTININMNTQEFTYIPNLIDPENTRRYRGWSCMIYHSVSNNKNETYLTTKNNIVEGLDYLKEHEDDYCVDTFTNVIKYIRERNSASLTTSADANHIYLDLTSDIDNKDYNYPLTVKVKFFPEWDNVNAVQETQTLDSTIITDTNRIKYTLKKIIPNRGEVLVTRQ